MAQWRSVFRFLFLLIFVAFRSVNLTESRQLQLTQGDVREYCEWETFNATCSSGEVIIIGFAKYGRMRLGRCVTKNYGHLGCGSDVTSYFDGRCSGRHSCEISVIKLHDKISCPTDFKSYLEASFECVKVLVPSEESCTNMTRFEPTGIIASVTVFERNSFVDCPWSIRMQPHQRVNISLFDFSAPPSEGVANYVRGKTTPPGECIDYGVVSEGWGRMQANVSICGGRRRQSAVYVSNSHSVEIRIRNSFQTPYYFLLKYEAFGCFPLVAPPGSWMTNSGYQVVIRCNDTDESWRLICRGRSWDGYLGNCSAPAAAIQDEDEDWTMDNNFPYGILLVIALGVLIGVAAGVLMLLGVLAYMRRRRVRKVRSRSNYIIDETIMTRRSVDAKTAAAISAAGKSAERRTPSFKPKASSVIAGGGNILLDRQGSWQRTRPLPDPDQGPSDDGGGVGVMPAAVATSELPLLSSPYSLEHHHHHHHQQQQSMATASSGGMFGTFGIARHDQCVDLLRHRAGVCGAARPAVVGVEPGAGGGTPCTSFSPPQESGHYYFKLDLSTGGRHDHHDAAAVAGLSSPCFMCQAGSPRGSRPMAVSSAASSNQIQL